jgi:hypothetical protein
MFLLPSQRVIAIVVALLATAVMALSGPAVAAAPLQQVSNLTWTSIDYKPSTHSFHARLGSSMGLCLPNRSVQLMKVTRGPDRVVATGTTNLFGAVRFGGRHWRSGGYYVEFSPIFRFDHRNGLVACVAAASETMHLH